MTPTGKPKAKAEPLLHIAMDRATLLKQLTKCLPFVERKTTIPIMANVLLITEHDRLILKASDLDIFFSTASEAKVKSEGAITIPAKMLTDTLVKLSKVPDMADEVSIKVSDGNWVTVECGTFKVKVPGMAASNFPSPDKMPGKNVVQLPADVLNTMIEKTRSCIATKESRYTLNGAKVTINPDYVEMATTDGHRLAVIQRTMPIEGRKQTMTMILTSATLDRLKPFISKDNKGRMVGVELNENGKVFFSLGHEQLNCRLLTGQFPNVEAVMPKSDNGRYNKIAYLDSKRLASALALVAEFSDERSRAVKFELIPGKGLKLSASCTESGEASQEVAGECESPNASPVAVGFNAEYVLDWLKTVNGSGAKLSVRDEQSAVLWEPIDGGEYSYRTVIMPMRV